MKHRWDTDNRFPDDLDLGVIHGDNNWHMVAFVRWHANDKQYVCRFLNMTDDEFPDGERFKTKRGAMRFCERHLPVMWIRHNAKTGADE